MALAPVLQQYEAADFIDLGAAGGAAAADPHDETADISVLCHLAEKDALRLKHLPFGVFEARTFGRIKLDTHETEISGWREFTRQGIQGEDGNAGKHHGATDDQPRPAKHDSQATLVGLREGVKEPVQPLREPAALLSLPEQARRHHRRQRQRDERREQHG